MTATPASSPELYEGIQGQEAAVKELQNLLRNKGYTTVTVDGIFGAKTTQAVKDFQTKNGLTADGVVGTKTWAALRSGGGGGGQPVKLVDVCNYYDPTKYPHQTKALEWLQNNIPKATLDEFSRRWRNP
jgi:peptidoglycan hydrolase-like protein with peptidoglycan-binding domain